jgi:hypothetical protein
VPLEDAGLVRRRRDRGRESRGVLRRWALPLTQTVGRARPEARDSRRSCVASPARRRAVVGLVARLPNEPGAVAFPAKIG